MKLEGTPSTCNYSFQTTYEELKPEGSAPDCKDENCFQTTYEELKLFILSPTFQETPLLPDYL